MPKKIPRPPAFKRNCESERAVRPDAAISPHAQPPLQQWKARPLTDRPAQLSFVADDDRGCCAHGLFPSIPLLVQACEQFLGVGIYQLFNNGKLEVRFCRQADVDVIEMTIDGPRNSGGGHEFILRKDFEEKVCGLVLAQIEGINEQWTAELFARRAKLYL